jgi:hypothetical protein
MNRISQGNWQVWKTQIFSDSRGKLGSIETKHLPFEPKRLFWLFEVSPGETRGNHGHFECNQFICCLSGHISLKICPPASASTVIELRAGESLFIPVRHWISISFQEAGTVCGVFADTDYDPTDVFDEPIA